PARRFDSAGAFRRALAQARAASAAPAVRATARPGKARNDEGGAGLVFANASGWGRVEAEARAGGGRGARAAGRRYVIVLDGSDEPERAARSVAMRLLESRVCDQVRIDVGRVTVRIGPDGERRYLSPAFFRDESFPVDGVTAPAAAEPRFTGR